MKNVTTLVLFACWLSLAFLLGNASGQTKTEQQVNPAAESKNVEAFDRLIIEELIAKLHDPYRDRDFEKAFPLMTTQAVNAELGNSVSTAAFFMAGAEELGMQKFSKRLEKVLKDFELEELDIPRSDFLKVKDEEIRSFSQLIATRLKDKSAHEFIEEFHRVGGGRLIPTNPFLGKLVSVEFENGKAKAKLRPEHAHAMSEFVFIDFAKKGKEWLFAGVDWKATYATTPKRPLVDRIAIAGSTFDDRAIDLNDYHDKVVMVFFWETSYAPYVSKFSKRNSNSQPMKSVHCKKN